MPLMKEDIGEWVKKLRDSQKLILVEGKKDKSALEKLDIVNVKTLKEPLFKAVETIADKYKEVIILTDLDKEGKKLYAKLNRDFQMRGIKVDHFFREFLFKNTKLRQIEGLTTYLG